MVMFQRSLSGHSTAMIILLGLAACSPAPKGDAVVPSETSASTPVAPDGTANSGNGVAPVDEARPSPATSGSGVVPPEPNLAAYGKSAVLAVDGQGLRLIDPKTKVAARIAVGRSKPMCWRCLGACAALRTTAPPKIAAVLTMPTGQMASTWCSRMIISRAGGWTAALRMFLPAPVASAPGQRATS